MSVFKAYDIRGVYNVDFDKKTVYRIGFFLPKLLNVDRILVGRDVRVSSPEIFEELSRGIMDAGCDVVDLGLCTTPSVYFATAFYDEPAGVQITASHNPKEYNGLKISRAKAIPVGGETGLKELESMVLKNEIKLAKKRGNLLQQPIHDDYVKYLKPRCADMSAIKVGVDCSNGMASLYVKDLLGPAGPSLKYIFDTLDGTFPNHEPNPLEEENCAQIKKLVTENGLDVGVIYDGDADRVMFIDEKGRFIRPDIVTAILAKELLEKPDQAVLVDIRTSRAVIEYIERLGGKVTVWKVGHAFAKLKIKEIKAVVGGELAGHYYFRDFFNCDSGLLASLIILQVVANLKKEGRTLAGLIDEIDIYANSGEINFKIEKKDEAIAAAEAYAQSADKLVKTLTFDGFRFEYADWWFNVRVSNTEPYLRLVLEDKTPEALIRRLSELKAILGAFAL